MLRPSLPLSVLQVLEHVLLQEWQAPEWVGSWGACGRGQLELKGFPLGLPFREGMSPFLPPPPSPCSDFHPHTPKQVTRAGNNSASLETLPPAFGSLLEKQICLQSDIRLVWNFGRDQMPSGSPLCSSFMRAQTELEERCVIILSDFLWESTLALVSSPQSSMNLPW